MDKIKAVLKEEFGLADYQVNNVIELIDDGNTIPFIARYRKEKTGEMSDEVLRSFFDRLSYLRSLEDKKSETARLIDEQGKLTEEISASIAAAATLTELEDIYRPFRPKRRTRASIARDRGLAPLAELLFAQGADTVPEEAAAAFIDAEKGVENNDEALAGARDIIAEEVSDDPQFRKIIRELTMHNAVISSKAAKEEDSVYINYYDFSEKASKLAPHRTLALNRGEKEGFLSVKLEMDEDIIFNYLLKKTVVNPSSPCAPQVEAAVRDSYSRLIAPSVATEIRNMLTEAAQESSIKVFGKNLSGLLLQPPVKGQTVLGVDPGYRTGCKLAVVDETGKVLATGVGYFTLPNHDREKAEKLVGKLISDNNVSLVSIGNGTASKEAEIFIAGLIGKLDRPVYYMMTNEAGASVYSASKLATEEFPEYDVSLRSAVSIARRLQDPLAELVKIDPKSIGVGQYQHDMNQKRLGETLGAVVEDCVNSVGVDLNTASPSLLSYVAGINKTIAKNIEAYRNEIGKFTKRKELLKVPKLGAKAFEQCAGFLRITDGSVALDNTSVHPESYEAAGIILSHLGYSEEDVFSGNLDGLKDKIKSYGASRLAEEAGIGLPTLRDIADSLLKRGRDPRDELPKPVLRTDVMSMEDLKPGMEMTGTVRNVIDFGAFVDIGVHQDGLVHISQICDKYISHPSEVLQVGDIIKVKVLDVDVKKNRISLTMKL
ncbi:MAG: RNA-binding transcriptional accessory protein [Clostridia bacterium]|nr:RNA-binding transcriptional accessory protein [Clostridia bacterium]